jgi:hypothetical protein
MASFSKRLTFTMRVFRAQRPRECDALHELIATSLPGRTRAWNLLLRSICMCYPHRATA